MLMSKIHLYKNYRAWIYFSQIDNSITEQVVAKQAAKSKAKKASKHKPKPTTNDREEEEEEDVDDVAAPLSLKPNQQREESESGTVFCHLKTHIHTHIDGSEPSSDDYDDGDDAEEDADVVDKGDEDFDEVNLTRTHPSFDQSNARGVYCIVLYQSLMRHLTDEGIITIGS